MGREKKFILLNMEKKKDHQSLHCHLDFLSFLFGIGPFGTLFQDKKIDVNNTDLRNKTDYEFKLRKSKNFKNLRNLLAEDIIVMSDHFENENNEPPIVLITISIVLMMASVSEIRTTFFANFQGNLPNIVLYLLEQIGIGKLNDQISVNKIVLSNYFTDIMVMQLFLGGTCLSPNYYFDGDAIDEFLNWFNIIQNNIDPKTCPYFTLSPAKPTPFYKKQLGPLFELWVWEERICYRTDGQFIKLNKDQQRLYFMYAVVFDIKFADETHYLKPEQFNYNGCIEITKLWPNEECLIKEFISFALDGVDEFFAKRESV